MAHIRYLDMLELKRKSKHNRLPEIAKFTISGRLIALAADCAHLHFEIKDGCTRDVYAKKESWLAKYEITRETIDVYSCGVNNGMLDLDLFAPLDEVTLFTHIRTSYMGIYLSYAFRGVIGRQ